MDIGGGDHRDEDGGGEGVSAGVADNEWTVEIVAKNYGLDFR